jgi:DNA-binding PadR family transcriptional regulator
MTSENHENDETLAAIRAEREALQAEREAFRQQRNEEREQHEAERDAYRAARDSFRNERDARRGERGDRSQRARPRGWDGPGPTPPFPPMPPMPPFGGPGAIFGPDGIFGPGGVFGPGGPFGGHQPGPRRHGGWDGRGRKTRAGRGDVRAAVLLILDEGPANGYQIMQQIEERTNGQWKPSSGSVYPVLQQLSDEGLIEDSLTDGRRTVSLTAEGTAYLEANRDQLKVPWLGGSAEEPEEDADDETVDEAIRVRDAVGQLAMAYLQVVQVGTAAQRGEALRVLTGARQSLYRILASDDTGE